MKVLFLPNWDVRPLEIDNPNIQSPDKQISGEPYWFFRYFPEGTEVDIIDRQRKFLFHKLESRYLKFYIYQSLKAFFCWKKYDVVLSHGAQSGLFYSLLNRLRAKNKRPLHVIIDVGGLNGGRTNSFEILFIKMALKSRPGIIYHSSVQEELYKKIYKGIIVQSRFIRFGANMDEFFPQIKNTKKYILSFGYAKRDYDTLLKTWKQMDSDVDLFIVGSPLIRSEGNIRSFPKVNIIQLKEYIAQCLFVVIPLPVYNYSYGQMSFIQSMALAKPVVITRTPSTVDYLQETGSGAFFVNPYDVEDMKQKLTFLLDNQEQLSSWGQNARKYVETYLNEEKMGKEIFQFITECKAKTLCT